MVVLFDLDGVVLDTESQYTVLWNNIGKKYGDVGEIGRLSKGQTLTHILDTYFKGQTELQKHIIEELYEFEQNMSYAPIPGVMEFMKQLKAASVPTAVVTSSNKAKMENVYRHYPDFKDIVGHVFTSESFTRSKPDPECFLMAMRALGGNAGRYGGVRGLRQWAEGCARERSHRRGTRDFEPAGGGRASVRLCDQ